MTSKNSIDEAPIIMLKAHLQIIAYFVVIRIVRHMCPIVNVDGAVSIGFTLQETEKSGISPALSALLVLPRIGSS
jgi:hypothetical protein